MAPKKLSLLQKKVLMFYRDYLVFAKTKPEVRPVLGTKLMTESSKVIICMQYIAPEDVAENVCEGHNREESGIAQEEFSVHRARPQDGAEQAGHVQDE